ncbi:hypothetical protein BDW02DRAFT_258890 [Decorospora gaudefroyi]|uniref:Mus7/MMS22 family-domain-containing protein n=1 Tax=Decorospora gaudefroyi TaxID=184978 RepID=A0A6A5KNQ5_9PLEO|nr:hypothetical protein BDW02DRAFT_258890 [Decorospora gaudefroyi]
MSRWRQKGFVQDSDEEEEEESQIESQSSRPNAGSSGRVERVEDGVGHDGEHMDTREKAQEGREEGPDQKDVIGISAEFQAGERPIHTPTRRSPPRPPTLSPLTPKPIQDSEREPTESPDPLQSSLTPKSRRIVPPRSSQRLASPIFQPSPSVSVPQLDDHVAIPSPTAGGSVMPPQPAVENNASNNTHASNVFEQLGISPLSDDSGDGDLSDPPTDMESPPTAHNMPHRRTAVQVLIPSSTALQKIADQRAIREFRQRKPIQLHPYALEGELYRREVQSRGLKPVRRERSRSRSPQGHRTHQQDETQEQDFNPGESPTSSPPDVEIAVSTPALPPPKKDAQGANSVRQPTSKSARRLASTQLRLPHPAKRRKLNLASTQVIAAPRSIFEDNDLRRDIWSIPPNSPPYSSSPPRNGNNSALRIGRLRVTTPAPNLPTPSTSSVVQDDLQLLGESDSEPVPRSVQKPNGEVRRPTRVINTDSSTSAAESDSETEQGDKELKHVGRKIKGVLPASWLRFDRQAQERRKAQHRERPRAQSDVALSPGPTGPIRGVAQRITKPAGRPRQIVASGTPSRDLVLISDDSDDELRAPPSRHAQNVQDSVKDASELAAIFDDRYANDNLSDMEHDPLHLPTLGGAPKRKRQTKLTDAFGKAKKQKLSDGVARAVGHRKRSVGGQSRRRKHGSSRVVRRTPPPAMSVIDVDISPSCQVPQFLKVARRQALGRPDLARQSPRNKHIRLHNAQDTEEANITLRQWRQGTLKPKSNVVPQQGNIRRPLAGKVDNQQYTDRLSISDARSTKSHDAQSESGTDGYRTRRRKRVPAGLHIFQRSLTQRTQTAQRRKSGLQPSKTDERSERRGPHTFRTAQLEGDEHDFGRGHRKIAFEKGLLRVGQQFGLQLPREQPFINPQLARYLADDTALPPLPSANDIGEHSAEVPAEQAAPLRKRLKRKIQAQRIDVDAREYRQPSEPAVQDIIQATGVIQQHENRAEHDLPVLHGLGPYGTRYPITFDVHSFASETYFHPSTFIGSDELRRAFTTGKSNGRNLDEPAGYCNIIYGALSVRCGPWNDETSSRLHDLTRTVLATSQANGEVIEDGVPLAAWDLLTHSARFLRTLIAYISDHLSFLDPVDRKDFIAKLVQITLELIDGIIAGHSAVAGRESASTDTENGVRAMAYVFALSTQMYRIAQHATVDPNCQVEIISMIKNVSKTLVTHIVQQGVGRLGNFLEQNKRQSVREHGVQESDAYVESVVICIHALEEIDMPAWGFWDLVSQALYSKVAKATHTSAFEASWAALFTLVPFNEIDISGMPLRSRREDFQGDSWACIRDILRRLFELYPSTHSKHSASLNGYVRANLARSHRLISYWHWKRPELMLNAVFDFFGKNGLKPLRREANSGSAPFLNSLATEQSLSIEPNENSFHIALKCLALGLQGMKDSYPEKKIRSFVFRTLPNHGRAYPKDQPLEEESLVALRNHHDLLSTLYWAALPPCRPKLDHIRDLVNHESSHREACRLSVRAWANLATFQLATDEPYSAAKPFALWHKDIMHQTLRQYKLAKTEADDYLKSGVLDGTTDVSAVMVRQTMERNQEQVIATLRDCIAGMKNAIQHARDQSSLRTFLIDSDIMHLLELPHLEDRRLVNVIRDTLKTLQDYVRLRRALLKKEVSQQTSEESQDYGDFPDMDDFDYVDPHIPEKAAQQSGLDFIQTPLWHLLSNAFGAESSPDDNLLMDCVDTWVRITESQVSSGDRSWSYYLDSFSQVSWKQLRQTEQTRKFGPYFMAALLDCDSTAYEEHRHDFHQTLLLCLVERESMLRFQHRLLHAITRTADEQPLLKNLPFFRQSDTSELDITVETVRTRRLALISSILSNMRDDVQRTSRNEPARAAEVKRLYAVMLKSFMTTMKYNYQQLHQGTTVTGAYVEFVQKIVQFLKQYTSDICPVLPFFTDSVAFPLPAGDPTYVVARLCGYAPKLSDPGTAKQLSVFIQTVAQQATADNQQPYLVNQLTTALCTDEAPSVDRIALRSVLFQGIFPVYLEASFSSSTAFVIARPILQALPSILKTTIFDLRITQPDNLSSIVGCIVSTAHAFIRGTEHVKNNPPLLQHPHILAALTHMLESITAFLPLLDYICTRTTTTSYQQPSCITYIHDLTTFITHLLHNPHHTPDPIPHYPADTRAHPHQDLVSFCRRGLDDSLKTNWAESADTTTIWFGQGHARREVVVDIGTVEQERECLVGAIGTFWVALMRDGDSGGGGGGGGCASHDVVV